MILKTVKDLRIDDTVYRLVGTTVSELKVKGLNPCATDKKYILNFNGENCSNDLYWDGLKDNTIVTGYYSSHLYYLNHSEVIIELKKRLCAELDNQILKIQEEMFKLTEIKNEIAKYL